MIRCCWRPWICVEQKHGHEKEARDLYERVLKLDPLANDAATGIWDFGGAVGRSSCPRNFGLISKAAR